MKRPRAELLPWMLAALLLCPALVRALSSDRMQPVYIEANHAEINDKQGISIYRGDVKLTRGSMHLTADTLTVHHSGNAIDELVAIGNPATYREIQDKNNSEVRANAGRMEYHAGTGQLVLLHDAKLWQDVNEFGSERIVYDTNTELVNAGDLDSNSQRVHITIHPKDQPPQSATAAPPAAPPAPQ